ALATALHSTSALADTRTEARRHFKAGMVLVQKKNYAEGIKELEKAYEILPHPNVAFNIAQAQGEAGNLRFAIRAYQTYLKSEPPERAEVAATVKQLEEKSAAQRAAVAAPAAATPPPAGPGTGATPEPVTGSPAGPAAGTPAATGTGAAPGKG